MKIRSLLYMRMDACQQFNVVYSDMTFDMINTGEIYKLHSAVWRGESTMVEYNEKYAWRYIKKNSVLDPNKDVTRED